MGKMLEGKRINNEEQKETGKKSVMVKNEKKYKKWKEWIMKKKR